MRPNAGFAANRKCAMDAVKAGLAKKKLDSAVAERFGTVIPFPPLTRDKLMKLVGNCWSREFPTTRGQNYIDVGNANRKNSTAPEVKKLLLRLVTARGRSIREAGSVVKRIADGIKDEMSVHDHALIRFSVESDNIIKVEGSDSKSEKVDVLGKFNAEKEELVKE